MDIEDTFNAAVIQAADVVLDEDETLALREHLMRYHASVIEELPEGAESATEWVDIAVHTYMAGRTYQAVLADPEVGVDPRVLGFIDYLMERAR